jgi:transposase
MDSNKYVALDVHSATIVVAVHNAAGKCVMESVIETKANTVRDFVKAISGRVHVTFEQGTQSAWLYDLIKPLVAEVIVCNPQYNKLISGSGNKSDRIDANKLAMLLRQGGLKGVYQGEASIRTLKEYVSNYEALVSDSVRVMNRIKGMFRARAISCSGMSIYEPSQRSKWLTKLDHAAVRSRAESLYRQLDYLKDLRKEARSEMLAESGRNNASRILRRVPSLGPIWVAQILATVATPYRFRTKRQFWAYCGLAVTTRSSADFEFFQGRLRRRRRPSTARGLNRNYSRRLKNVFKNAAIHSMIHDPFRQVYERLTANGMRPELARLTLARKIAAVTLAIWKREETFDPKRLLGSEWMTKNVAKQASKKGN